MKKVKWYHFWNPGSGLIGGLILMAVFFAIAGVLMKFTSKAEYAMHTLQTIGFIYIMIFMIYITWVFMLVPDKLCYRRMGKEISYGEISQRQGVALKALIKSYGTRPFLMSVGIAMIGIHYITKTLHGNVAGILYPQWQINWYFILLLQFIPVLTWYMWVITYKKFEQKGN